MFIRLTKIGRPFRFCFDADKPRYVQYFKDIHTKLNSGGTLIAQDVLQNRRGISECMEFEQTHPEYLPLAVKNKFLYFFKIRNEFLVAYGILGEWKRRSIP